MSKKYLSSEYLSAKERQQLNWEGKIGNFSGCRRCGDTWNWKQEHVVMVGASGVFALCEECWQKLTPEARWHYHQELLDSWKPHDDYEALEIQNMAIQFRRAVLEGEQEPERARSAAPFCSDDPLLRMPSEEEIMEGQMRARLAGATSDPGDFLTDEVKATLPPIDGPEALVRMNGFFVPHIVPSPPLRRIVVASRVGENSYSIDVSSDTGKDN